MNRSLHAHTLQETEALVRSVKAVKAKEKQLRDSGIGGSRAGKMAADMVSGAGKKKSDKRKKVCGLKE